MARVRHDIHLNSEIPSPIHEFQSLNVSYRSSEKVASSSLPHLSMNEKALDFPTFSDDLVD
jgi:hypothetical protein